MNKDNIYFAIFKRTTHASLITLGVYIITSLFVSLLGAIFEDHKILFTVVLSIIYSAAFCYVYIYYTYLRTGEGIKLSFSEYKDKKWTIKDDLRLVLKQEYRTLIVFAAINVGSWMFINLESYLLGKRIVTALLFVYAPMQLIGQIFPPTLGRLAGFVAASVLIAPIYVIMIMFFRRKWSK